MTLLEKAKQEHPELDEGKIVTWMCPCDLGYEKLDDGCEQMAVDGAEACVRCWNREAAREAARETGATSSAAAAAPSPQGEGKAPSPQGEGNGEGDAGDGL